MKRMQSFFAIALALTLLPGIAIAQATISGRVTSDGGEALPGVALVIQGTGLGAQTDAEGRYRIAISGASATGQTATLTARRIGYVARSVQVTLSSGSMTRDFTLTAAPNVLEGVVVTALGIEREKRSVGTSVQNLTGNEITQARETNIVNSLAGKVSGVTITNAGSQGGSSRLVIRGANSIAGNNQPLFIVDGIPVSNQVVGAPAGFGGVDYGNAIQDLNGNDIANVSILKGPNAAALYGSRAANGAVVITTRSGKGSPRGFAVSASSNITFETPLRLPDYQNEYGQGSGGEFEYVDGEGGGVNDGVDESWGPKFDGKPRAQFFGVGPWVAAPNNVRDFFETGRTMTNNVSFSGTGERANARLSFTKEDLNGLAPGMALKKFATALNAGAELGQRFSTSASVQYINNKGFNRNGTGYDNGNFMQQFVWFGRQVDILRLRDPRKDADGKMINWNHNYHDNPYWIQLESQNRDQRDRIIGAGSLTFRPSSWLTATLRSGTDWFRDYRKLNRAYGLVESPFGGFTERNIFTQETNSEALLTATRSLSSRLEVTANFGGNLRKTQFKQNLTDVDALVVPAIYNVGNAQNTPFTNAYEEAKQVNSLYGMAQFAWNNYLFLDVTGRNDWSSTLPANGNSYFYPSVSGSFVFTDAFPRLSGSFLQYGKLRAGFAKVGNDATPYQLQSTYTANTPFGGSPRYSVPNSLANANLKPEETKAFEVGAELNFFSNRLGLDLTFYNKATTNQILAAQISGASGYTSKSLNAGKISNKGIDALLTATPIRLGNGFEWNTALNFSRNRSRVDELHEDLQTVVLGSYWSLTVEARKGEPYGALYGSPFLRDAAGNLRVSASGRPMRDPQKRVLGNYTPDWTAGFSNSFRFKSLDLSFLLDKHQGGDVFSVTNMFGRYSGVLKETLVGRDTGIVVQGVLADGSPNTRRISAEAYNHSLYGTHEAHVFDASYLKLREAKLGLVLPGQVANRLGVSRAYLALVGRNLWLSTKVPHIDPETAFSSGNAQGLEHGQFPSQRSIGINLSITP
ncbi:MAG: SusC/RagA family TonB-linked outer membrane protein [Gemmatimonadaceae bacterium]